jgi:RNA polymerase sigma-70 factor (ECF subfamily)
MKETNNKHINSDPSSWVTNYADYLYNFAFVRVNKKEIAEDLVQDTFVSALNSLKGFKGNSSEKTWMTTILKNKIIDYYRKKGRQHSSIDDSKDINANDKMDYYFDNNKNNDGQWNSQPSPTDWKTTFETPYDKKEFHKILEKCLSKVPERWAVAFKLKHFDDCTSEEICNELMITPSNYWVIIHRVKLQLRDCMEQNWYNS